MKNFTLFAMGLFCAAAMSAQTLTFTEVWNQSTGGTYVPKGPDEFTEPGEPGVVPEYINGGGETERSMAIYNNKLYIPTRKDGNKIAVVDQMTGVLEKYITLPDDVVTGGTYAINQCAIDEDGVMLIGNLTTAASVVGQSAPFKAYTCDLTASEPTFKLAFEIPNTNDLRLGDGIGIYGSIEEGESTVIIPQSGGVNVVIAKLTNGRFVSQQIVETPVNFAISPAVVQVTENDFTIKAKDTKLTKFNMDGTVKEEMLPIEPDKTPHDGISSGVFFEFGGKNYILMAAVNVDGAPLGVKGDGHEGIFQVIEVPADGISGDVELVSYLPSADKGLQAPGAYAGERQTAFVAPVCVDVRPDCVYLYMLWPKNGVACYKMTVGGTSIANNTADAVSVYPNPATDVLNISGDIALVEFYTIAGQKVMAVANQNTIDVAGLQGMYLVKITDAAGNVTSAKVSVK